MYDYSLLLHAGLDNDTSVLCAPVAVRDSEQTELDDEQRGRDSAAGRVGVPHVTVRSDCAIVRHRRRGASRRATQSFLSPPSISPTSPSLSSSLSSPSASFFLLFGVAQSVLSTARDRIAASGIAEYFYWEN